MDRPAMTPAASIKAAFDRARGRAALVHFLATSAGGYDAYAVGSTCSVDTAYTVTVLGADYRCTCQAEANVACWHRAAVFNHRASREAFGQPARPTWGEAEMAALMKPPTRVAPRRLPPTEEDAAMDRWDRQAAARRLARIAADFS